MTAPSFNLTNPPNRQAARRDIGRTTSPALLDRLADAELQHGHRAIAEFLARRAAEMREAAP